MVSGDPCVSRRPLGITVVLKPKCRNRCPPAVIRIRVSAGRKKLLHLARCHSAAPSAVRARQHTVQSPRDLPTGDPCVYFNRRAFTGKTVHHGQRSQRASVGQRIGDEIQRPFLIGPCEQRVQRCDASDASFSSGAPSALRLGTGGALRDRVSLPLGPQRWTIEHHILGKSIASGWLKYLILGLFLTVAALEVFARLQGLVDLTRQAQPVVPPSGLESFGVLAIEAIRILLAVAIESSRERYQTVALRCSSHALPVREVSVRYVRQTYIFTSWDRLRFCVALTTAITGGRLISRLCNEKANSRQMIATKASALAPAPAVPVCSAWAGSPRPQTRQSPPQ
jgi:hypothetical protein